VLLPSDPSNLIHQIEVPVIWRVFKELSYFARPRHLPSGQWEGSPHPGWLPLEPLFGP
jgi:hypothetical protein